MVNLLFIEDDDALIKPGVVRLIYDPTAGTGGILSLVGEHQSEHNPDARLVMYGQELNPESCAICKADMLIKGRTSPTSSTKALNSPQALHGLLDILLNHIRGCMRRYENGLPDDSLQLPKQVSFVPNHTPCRARKCGLGNE